MNKRITVVICCLLGAVLVLTSCSKRGESRIIIKNNAPGKMENISVTYTIDGSTKTQKAAYISEGEYTSFEISFPLVEDQASVIPFAISYEVIGEKFGNEDELILNKETNKSLLYVQNDDIAIITGEYGSFFVQHVTKEEFKKAGVQRIYKMMYNILCKPEK